MNAAEQFGVEELGQATLTFMRHCVNVCTACELLKSAERYIQYKSTKGVRLQGKRPVNHQENRFGGDSIDDSQGTSNKNCLEYQYNFYI